MSSVAGIIKKSIPLRWKCKLNAAFHPDEKWLQYSAVEQKRIFVFLAGFYQNLGDLAITYVQIRFLQKIYPEARVIAVPSEETFTAIPMIKRYIRSDDLVTLIGGGNMSSLYVHLETARREVIRSFPKHQIISFPQTVYFDDSKIGKKELNTSKRVYNNHPHLLLFARETESYQRMRLYFPRCEAGLVPDIVLSLDKVEPVLERNGVLVCLRKDKEQSISGSFREILLEEVRKTFSAVEVTDTTEVELSECLPGTYEATLERFWTKIKTSKVVLTDRLHCMIFCAITGTPCVVLDNLNHKVSSVYESWLKNSGFIHVCNELDCARIFAMMREAESSKKRKWDRTKIEEAFGNLSSACRR